MTCVRCNKARSHHDCPACDGHLCAACCYLATCETEAELASLDPKDVTPMTAEEIEDSVRWVMNRKWQAQDKT